MSNTPSAHTRTEHTEWPRAVTPYPVLKPGCGVRVWAVASPPRPSRAPRATGLAKSGYACTGRASLPVGSHAQSLLGPVRQCLRPGQLRLRSPRASPSPWVPGGGQWKPLPLWPRCRRAALESETSERERRRSSLYPFRLFGSPFPKLLAKSVSAGRIVCTKAKALAEPPFPAHSAANGTIFQVFPKNSFPASVCLSGGSRADPRRGVAGARGAAGCRALGEPARSSACPRCPFRPSLRDPPGDSAPFLPRHRFDGVG